MRLYLKIALVYSLLGASRMWRVNYIFIALLMLITMVMAQVGGEMVHQVAYFTKDNIGDWIIMGNYELRAGWLVIGNGLAKWGGLLRMYPNGSGSLTLTLMFIVRDMVHFKLGDDIYFVSSRTGTGYIYLACGNETVYYYHVDTINPVSITLQVSRSQSTLARAITTYYFYYYYGSSSYTTNSISCPPLESVAVNGGELSLVVWGSNFEFQMYASIEGSLAGIILPASSNQATPPATTITITTTVPTTAIVTVTTPFAVTVPTTSTITVPVTVVVPQPETVPVTEIQTKTVTVTPVIATTITSTMTVTSTTTEIRQEFKELLQYGPERSLLFIIGIIAILALLVAVSAILLLSRRR